MLLLDTDILVDVMRKFSPALAWLRSVDDQELAAPGFVAMELCAGCRDGNEQRKTDRVIAGLNIIWPSPTHCDFALELYRRLHLAYGLSTQDALIAQTALELNQPLHSFNVKHYAPIEGLQTIQPYRR